MRPLPFLALAVSLSLAALAPAPAAQPALGGHVEALMRARQASTARARGDLDEAVRLYREALELGAPPHVLRELALTLESQQRRREAAGAWNRYAALASVDADRRAAAERAEGLRRTLTALRVRVEPAALARTARVWFDHDPPRWYAAGGVEQVAEGGRHRVRVEAEGCDAWEMMVTTGYGDPVQVVAVMRRAAR